MAKKTAVASGPDLFAKAAKAAPKKEEKQKGTVFVLPIEVSTNPADREQYRSMTPECARVHDAISDMHVQNRLMNTAQGKFNTAKGIAMPVALKLLIKKWVAGGVLPGTPMKVQNDKGEEVTLVFQDRSANAVISDEQLEQFEDLVGADAAAEIVQEAQVFTLNPEVLDEEGVMAILSQAIQNSGLKPDQIARLLEAKNIRRLKPNLINEFTQKFGKDESKVTAALEIAGSAFVKYLKC